jgi:two-component system sensor histidine kinase/response regulator
MQPQPPESSNRVKSDKFTELERENALLRQELNTLREKHQQELVQARDNSSDQENSKNDFLANISHEIRTPLNGMLGMLHALHKSQDQERNDALIKTALNSGHLLADIINELLEFSAIETRDIELENNEFNLLQATHEVLQKVALSAEQKQLRLKFQPTHNVPLRITSDETRIKQLLNLLLNNAIKFTDSGEVTLKISIDDENHLALAITDTGCGIPEDKLHNIFRAFAQVDSSHTRKFGGIGLGLTICQRIAKAFNSTLEVESVIDQGSTFKLSIPISAHSHNNYFSNSRTSEYTILYCDSDKDSQVHARDYFSKFEIETNTHNTIEEIDPETLDADRQYLLLLVSDKPDNKLALECQLLKDLTKNLRILLFSPQSASDIHLQNIDEHYFLPVIQPSLFSEINKKLNFRKNTALRPRREIARILVVDDNNLNLQVIQELLDGHSVKLAFANNGEEALSMIKDQPFDAVLMDIQMPKMDGLTCTRKVRAFGGRYLELPIIAMTAHALKEDKVKSLSAGMDAHLTKPIVPDELFNCLNEQLGRTIEKSVSEEENTIPSSPDIENFDFPEALKRLRGNWQALRKLLLSFCEKNKNTYDEFENHIETDNLEAAQRIAHQLKGSGANLGAVGLANIAGKIEQSIKDRKLPLSHNELETFRSMLQQLDTDRGKIEQWGLSKDSPKTKGNISTPIKTQLHNVAQSLNSDIGKSQELIEALCESAKGTRHEELCKEISSLFSAFKIQMIHSKIETALREREL